MFDVARFVGATGGVRSDEEEVEAGVEAGVVVEAADVLRAVLEEREVSVLSPFLALTL